MQPVRKRLAARRATAGLAVANSREHNNTESLPHERSECLVYDRFLPGPKGAPQIDQCRVAVLSKGHAIPCGLRLALANLGHSAS